MAKAPDKITLSSALSIPLDKLVLSQSNVRQTKAGVSIDQLAEDIARRSLLQSLSVRPILDDEGRRTGTYEIPAGGRRYRALQLLVKQKRLAKDAPVPCVVRETGIAEDDSLAENTQRAALHPVDQFRAFQTLVDKGLTDEEIAARHFVTPRIVQQRLRLAAVSPQILDAYVTDEMTLDHVMAFTVNADHKRQEQIWAELSQAPHYQRTPNSIRQRLLQATIPVTDPRVKFVGLPSYEAAGGVVARDLFDDDDSGWVEDPTLLDQLVTDKLTELANDVAAEGWKWVKVAPRFTFDHTQGLRQIPRAYAQQSDEDHARLSALALEYDELEEEYAEADELPAAVAARLDEISAESDRLNQPVVIFDPEHIACAGAFVTIGNAGAPRIERGWAHIEDLPNRSALQRAAPGSIGPAQGSSHTVTDDAGNLEDDDLRPLPDRLVADLTGFRSYAIGDALGRQPKVAFKAIVHALSVQLFYMGYDANKSRLQIRANRPYYGVTAPSARDSAPAQAIDARHAAWKARLPADAEDLWEAMDGFDQADLSSLLAHCAGSFVDTLRASARGPLSADDPTERLARALGLDVAEVWKPTVENYLGRVPKVRILQAITEAKGAASAQLIDHLKKAEMATQAERLLADTGWVPEPLRLVRPADDEHADENTVNNDEVLPDFLAGGDDTLNEPSRAPLIAAE